MSPRLLPALLAAAVLGWTGCDRSPAAPPASGTKAGPQEAPKPPAAPPEKEKPPQAPAPAEEKWTELFDGKTLTNWKPTSFGGEGEVKVQDGQIVVEPGVDLSGVHWTGAELPKMNYELRLEAMKIEGSDIFCGISFTVGDAQCSFVSGGWGGGIVGLSSIDGMNASENETTKVMAFTEKKWYRFRLKVTPEKIEGWIDDEQVVNVVTKDKKISIHPMMEVSKPLGLATYVTRSAFRNIRIRRLS